MSAETAQVHIPGIVGFTAMGADSVTLPHSGLFLDVDRHVHGDSFSQPDVTILHAASPCVYDLGHKKGRVGCEVRHIFKIIMALRSRSVTLNHFRIFCEFSVMS